MVINNFEILTVYSKSGSKSRYAKVRYVECGCEFDIRVDCIKLRKGCNCTRSERFSESRMSHGLSNHSLYHLWHNIKYRCYNSSSPSYHLYGGKGVYVADDWLSEDSGFLNFYDWCISNGWYEGCNLSVDRFPDNDGPYSPQNCRFATNLEQSRNLRNNQLFEYKGILCTTGEILDLSGSNIPYATLLARLLRGWDVERALSEIVIERDRLLNEELAYIKEHNIHGLSHDGIRKRLKRGMSLAEALSTPPRKPDHRRTKRKQ